MLTMMRNMLRSPAAGGLFVLLILAMAAWGVTDVFGGGLGNNLIGAGKRSISDQGFDNVVERQLRNATDERGRALSKEQALENGSIDQIFSGQQFELLLRAYADTIGITATQTEIQKTITAIPAFRDTTDVFDPSRLAAYLRQEGFTQKTFEDRLEADLTISRLQKIPTAGLKTPTILARLEAAYNGEQRSADWFVLSSAALPELDAPSDEALQTLYEENEQVLREPERRHVSLIRLSPSDFLSRATVSDEEIEGFYRAYKRDRYTGPDTRSFTQFEFANEASARSALGAIAGGADADGLEGLETALTRSGQAGSIANERLSQQVFAGSALPGSLHGPMQVGPAWTIIRIEDITPGPETPMSDVVDEIREELAMEQAIGLFYEALPRFDDLIGTGAELEDIADELGTQLVTFAGVDQTGMSESGLPSTPIMEAEGLLASIFNLPEGANTERVGTDEVTYLARVDKILPERLPPLEEVRDELIEGWLQREGFQQMRKVAEAIEARILEGETTLAQEAAAYDADLQSLDRPILRTSQNSSLPSQLLGGVFNIREEGGILIAPLSPDEAMIVQVTKIARPAPETVSLMAEAAAPNLEQQLTNDLFQAFLTDVQNEIPLTINEAAFEAYKARITPDQ